MRRSQSLLTTRREFLAAGAALTILPRHVLGRGFQAPSDLVNVAVVGVGGMGASNLRAVMSQNIVALCDVDSALVDARLAQFSQSAARPQARRPAPPPAAPPPPGAPHWQEWGPSKAQEAANARFPAQDQDANLKKFVEQAPRIQRYADYREMLEKQKDIDAVIVATPDHMHAIIASAAMDLGKHVYVQKPMAWCVSEARHLAKRAAETKVQAQCGNQRHSWDEQRRGVDYISSGAIGEISHIHIWTNRPIWPQGLPRPKPFTADPSKRLSQDLVLQAAMGAVKGSATPPSTLAWDLFLGVAPAVEYDPIYHPFNWRGWVDWGQGALGDMGAHLIDFPVWALDLDLPTSVETTSTPYNDITFPLATMTQYDFPAKGKRKAVRLTWYDGGFQPPTPPELGEHARLAQSGGILYIGSKGKLLCNEGMPARLLPDTLHNKLGAPKERLARVPHEDHEMNWIRAIKGQDTLSSPFSSAAHLHEIMLLGLVSLRARSRITYDGAAMRITSPASANPYLTREYRPPYRL